MKLTKKRLLFLWMTCFGLTAGLPAAAQQSAMSEDDWIAIRAVINAQIDALLEDDAETAFSYASPALRKLFQTPRQFISMIRQNYAAVYRPRAFTFLPPSIVDDVPVQPVQVLAPDGNVVVALYSMQREGAAGSAEWKINGCQLVPLNAFYAALRVGRDDPVAGPVQSPIAGAFHFDRG